MLRKSNVLRRSFFKIVDAAGLRRVRFHDLRHTCATLLFQRGVHPKVAQERLGHSTIAITLDLYSHMMPNMQADAAAAVDNRLRAAISNRGKRTP